MGDGLSQKYIDDCKLYHQLCKKYNQKVVLIAGGWPDVDGIHFKLLKLQDHDNGKNSVEYENWLKDEPKYDR